MKKQSQSINHYLSRIFHEWKHLIWKRRIRVYCTYGVNQIVCEFRYIFDLYRKRLNFSFKENVAFEIFFLFFSLCIVVV